jgi:hypothetical protein
MVYLLKMVILHGYVSDNQMVDIKRFLSSHYTGPRSGQLITGRQKSPAGENPEIGGYQKPGRPILRFPWGALKSARSSSFVQLEQPFWCYTSFSINKIQSQFVKSPCLAGKKSQFVGG